MSTSPAAAPSANRSGEPSMEEILASIRKIIADDQKALDSKAPVAAAPAVPEPALPETPAEEEDDVLDLAQAIEPPAPPPPMRPAAPRAPEPVPIVPPYAPPRAQPAEQRSQLMSDEAVGATSKSFQSLATAVFTQNARTMDDVVADMLRPMLKSWLDENLPTLVERLVKAEIERVARGGR